MALQGLNIMLRVNGAVLVSDSGGLSIGNFDSRDDGGPFDSEKPSIHGNNVRKQTGMAISLQSLKRTITVENLHH